MVVRLSKRQVQVLNMIANGSNSKEIALKWSISWHTVRLHRYAILERLEAEHMAHAVAIAFRKNIIE